MRTSPWTVVRLFPTPALPGSGSTGIISGIAFLDCVRNGQPPRLNVSKFIQHKLNMGKYSGNGEKCQAIPLQAQAEQSACRTKLLDESAYGALQYLKKITKSNPTQAF